MYYLVHGAKKNVGDFLIRDRARALVEQELEGPFEEVPRDEEIPLADANAARGIILCGGPGYASRFHPDIFRLASPIEKLATPVLPLGVGWSGRPMLRAEEFQFTDESRKALEHISESAPGLGCRDQTTVDILHREGFPKARLVGCPAWYDLRHVEEPYRPPKEIRKLVFTPPQSVVLRWHAVQIMQYLAQRFPDAKRYCVFHRGWGLGKHARTPADAVTNQYLRLKARTLGFEPVNAAWDTQRIRFYDDCDLHIGYRLHAGIYFLAARKPSILLHEDGRGLGFSGTVGQDDVNAWDPDVVERLKERVEQDIDDGFRRHGKTCDVMRRTYPAMRRHIGQFAEETR